MEGHHSQLGNTASEAMNAELWRDDRQMVSLTVTQERLDRSGNAQYPGGCIRVDIEEV